MDQLRLLLLIVGVLLIAAIFVWELYKKRVALRRREELVAHLDADERSPLSGESVLGDIGQADPFDVVERVQGRRSVDHASLSDEGDEQDVVLEGYDIDEDFPGEPQESITEMPAAPAMAASPADDAASNEHGGLARLTGLAARRDLPEQLDLAGLALTAPVRDPDAGSERRVVNAARNEALERRRAALESGEEVHIVMTVMARPGERFSGDILRRALEGADLYHGAMNIFHRHEDPMDHRTPAIFSAANVLAPGYFEAEHMESMSSPGIAMFMRLPGPDDPANAFQQMLDAARSVADHLDGRLCDESRSTLTPQSINHLRERIADFGRRQMLKA